MCAELGFLTSISQNSHTGGVGCRPHITRQYSNNSMVVTYTCEQFVNFVHRMQVCGQLYQLLCSSTGYRGLLLKDSMPWCKSIGSKLLMGRIQKTRADSEVNICMYKQILVTGLVFFSFCCKEGDMNDRCNTIHSIGHATIIHHNQTRLDGDHRLTT